jgi:hypothetical protein
MWRKPVGDGAKRVTTGREVGLALVKALSLALWRAFLFSLCCNATDERP